MDQDQGVFKYPTHKCPQKGDPVAESSYARRGAHTYCEYCGSLHPDEFMRRLNAGEAVTPTDKAYKAYVGPDSAKFYYQHLSEAQRGEFIRLFNENAMKIAVPGYFYVLPYFCGVKRPDRRFSAVADNLDRNTR